MTKIWSTCMLSNACKHSTPKLKSSFIFSSSIRKNFIPSDSCLFSVTSQCSIIVFNRIFHRHIMQLNLTQHAVNSCTTPSPYVTLSPYMQQVVTSRTTPLPHVTPSRNNVTGSNSSHCSVTCAWSPDSRYFLTATLTPRMNVDNGFKVGYIFFIVNHGTLSHEHWLGYANVTTYS